jgi:hypothetical protein
MDFIVEIIQNPKIIILMFIYWIVFVGKVNSELSVIRETVATFFFTVTGSTLILTFIGIIAEKKLNTSLSCIYLNLSLFYIFFFVYFIKIKTNLLQIRNVFFSSAVSCYYGLIEFILPFLK